MPYVPDAPPAMTLGEMAVDRARRVMAGGSSSDADYCHVCGSTLDERRYSTECCHLPVHRDCRPDPPRLPCPVCTRAVPDAKRCCVVA